jgi:mono/diheme cytochrome c family protein
MSIKAGDGSVCLCLSNPRTVMNALSNRIVMVAALLALVGGSAVAAGRVEVGKAIGQRWCAACHQVSPEQAVANADVPSFMTIAQMRASPSALAALEGFLADPHPVMPDMSLTRQEISDLVAYIGSLN